jgi:predicted N-acetyltransferase YhbS
MEIRLSTKLDNAEIYNVLVCAFGDEEGHEIVKLVSDLFNDKTALPFLSLVAVDDGKIIGHILFTKAKITQKDEAVSVQILAPLAVLPEQQSEGVGKALIKAGLKELRTQGVELVFVLGHPDYYPSTGFIPAGKLGLEAPYPIPEKNEGAWMVQELRPGFIGKVTGKVQCSEALNQPEYWRE